MKKLLLTLALGLTLSASYAQNDKTKISECTDIPKFEMVDGKAHLTRIIVDSTKTKADLYNAAKEMILVTYKPNTADIILDDATGKDKLAYRITVTTEKQSTLTLVTEMKVTLTFKDKKMKIDATDLVHVFRYTTGARDQKDAIEAILTNPKARCSWAKNVYNHTQAFFADVERTETKKNTDDF